MNTIIKPFNFEGHQVRTVTIDDEPWFVLGDVCKVLEIANPRNVKDRLASDDPASVRTMDAQNSRGQMRETAWVNESGLYDVILDSRKPQAKAFRRWITSEVIPSIRKTGSYGVEEMTSDELMARAVLAADNKIKALESQNNQQAAELEAAAPKVDYHDTYVASEDLLNFRTVASTLNMKEKDLRNLLIEKKWIYRETTTRWSNMRQQMQHYSRYSEYANRKKYFRRVQHHEVPRFMGEVMHTLKITPEGAAAIANMVRRDVEGQVA